MLRRDLRPAPGWQRIILVCEKTRWVSDQEMETGFLVKNSFTQSQSSKWSSYQSSNQQYRDGERDQLCQISNRCKLGRLLKRSINRFCQSSFFCISDLTWHGVKTVERWYTWWLQTMIQGWHTKYRADITCFAPLFTSHRPNFV